MKTLIHYRERANCTFRVWDTHKVDEESGHPILDCEFAMPDGHVLCSADNIISPLLKAESDENFDILHKDLIGLLRQRYTKVKNEDTNT